MTTQSQIIPSLKIEKLVSGQELNSPQGLKKLQGIIFSSLKIIPYDDKVAFQEKAIRWKRTASQIINDGFVYEGKFCTDVVLVFLACCAAKNLETRFVKLVHSQSGAIHSAAEVKIDNGWYYFDVANLNNFPQKGRIRKNIKYGPYLLWKKGRDAWDIGLVNFESKGKINGETEKHLNDRSKN